MKSIKKNLWIPYLKPNPKATLRLFCFPYAGGSASVFRDWQNYLPNNVQVCPIEIPGRGSRLIETPFEDTTSLIKEITPVMNPYLDLPFAFFGHSLGALISFELAYFLQQEYNKIPVHLIVSGRQAPSIPERSPKYHLPAADLVTELKRLGGTPKEILENEELLELLLPIIKADLKMDETYDYRVLKTLSCPMTIFGGKEDPETTNEDLTAWQKHTNNLFSLEMFSGDHFFINSSRKLLLNKISEIMSY